MARLFARLACWPSLLLFEIGRRRRHAGDVLRVEGPPRSGRPIACRATAERRPAAVSRSTRASRCLRGGDRGPAIVPGRARQRVC